MNDPARDPDEPPDEQSPRPGNEPDSLSLWQIVTSTVAAAVGVQSSRNRQRDFSRGRALHFIVAGIVFTVLFVLTLVVVVNLVL